MVMIWIIYCSILFTFTCAQEFKFDNTSAGTPTANHRQLGDVTGMRAAVFQVHMEGNLGDEMETTPLLKQLKDWGMSVDAYSSAWMQETQKKVESRLVRPFKYIDHFYKDIPFDSVVASNDYDILILSPGPVAAEVSHCIKTEKMVWFGITASASGPVREDFNKVADCLTFVALREQVSFDEFSATIEKEEKLKNLKYKFPILLSGDISFSFEPINSLYTYWLGRWKRQLDDLIEKGSWTLIFSRENNFGPNKVNLVLVVAPQSQSLHTSHSTQPPLP